MAGGSYCDNYEEGFTDNREPSPSTDVSDENTDFTNEELNKVEN